MSWTTHVRAVANAKRAELGIGPAEPVSSDALCRLLQDSTGIVAIEMPSGDPLLGGAIGVLDTVSRVIWLADNLSKAVENATCAHEFGHYFLHSAGPLCNSVDLSDMSSGDNQAAALVEGYSPRQRREMEANMFASEFLFPLSLASELFVNQEMNAAEIASLLNLTFPHVCSQLSDAVLLPSTTLSDQTFPDSFFFSTPVLDEYQAAAAHAHDGPVLVSAGPGTGKTACLVERCRFLIKDKGALPQNILLLTFSRKAAQEMRERLETSGVAAGQASPWIGTFHGFGLEILRRYGESIGLGNDFTLLSPDDCELLLQNHISQLQLIQYYDSDVPERHIPAIRREISRAKGEGLSAADYLAAALAFSGAEREKLLETARCFDLYERLLKEINGVDFDDLIVKALVVLKNDDVLKQITTDFPFVLADEYQDVNRVTADLLHRLSGPGATGLWVVGDEKQTIYRFRGASPANVDRFRAEFPGCLQFNLLLNYRSVPAIIGLDEEAAKSFSLNSSASASTGWIAQRLEEDEDAIVWSSADSEETQAKYIANMVCDAEARLSEFAVLCRSHKKAQYIAEQLAERSIPTLRVNDLLEYSVVKDILAVMCASSRPDSVNANRAKSVGVYSDSLAPRSSNSRSYVDDMALLSDFSDNVPLLLDAVLWQAPQYARLLTYAGPDRIKSTEDRLAVSCLRTLAANFHHKKVRPVLMSAASPEAFIEFLYRQRASGGLRIGELEIAADVDAVRVMTIHAAKGLQFSTVIVPYLQVGQFPPSSGRSIVPRLPINVDTDRELLAEEQCLLFVAMTRAKNRLVLSRVSRHPSGRKISPSPLLKGLTPWLQTNVGNELNWTTEKVETEDFFDSSTLVDKAAEAEKGNASRNVVGQSYSASELFDYLDCPRRWFYRRKFGRSSRTFSDKGRIYSSVRECLTELSRLRSKGVPIDFDYALHVFDVIFGLSGEGLDDPSRNNVHDILRKFVEYFDRSRRLLRPSSLSIHIDDVEVRFSPDITYFDRQAKEFVFMALQASKPSSSDFTKPIYSVWRKAGADSGRQIKIEIYNLLTGEPVAVPEGPSEKHQLSTLRDGAYALSQGLFEPNPGEKCLRCEFHIVCPT